MLINLDQVYIKNNIEVNVSVIKTVFLIVSIFYTNFKITDGKMKINLDFIKKNIIIFIFGVLGAIIRNEINIFIRIICSVLIISIIFSKNKITKSIVATIISYAINYTITCITILFNFILCMIIRIENNYANLIFILINHVIMLCLFFKTKRFKKGFSFLKVDNENEYIDILVLNICIIIMLLIIALIHSDVMLAKDFAPGIVTAIIIMFVTIQKSIQLYYKQNLLVQELKETKEELEATKRELKQAEEENLSLSKKSHSISHKQKSLEHKIQQLLANTETSKEEVGEVNDRIKEIQKELNKDKVTVNLNKTEIPQIDDMLEYMQSECIKNKIDFELKICGNIYHMVNSIITKEDLEILLADHIKDAIIAINHTDNINRSILVRLGKIDGIYCLYIYDSGVEFKKQTLDKLGKEPITTYSNEGGTGMGFMNTFDTLKKYDASLIINELGEPSKENYTKILMFKFDKKKEFKVISYRS